MGGDTNVYDRNLPKYQMMANFQDFMLTMDKKDWNSKIKMKEESNYFGQEHASSQKSEQKILGLTFENAENMQTFFDA